MQSDLIVKSHSYGLLISL